MDIAFYIMLAALLIYCGVVLWRDSSKWDKEINMWLREDEE